MFNRLLGAMRSPNAEDVQKMRRQKALMNARVTPGGSVLVDCPYCLLGPNLDGRNGVKNPVDVTRFVDRGGKREHTTECSKGHRLRFKSVDEWRERRQLAGIQRG